MTSEIFKRTRTSQKWLILNVLIPVVLLIGVWYAVGDLLTNTGNLPGFDTYC